MKLARDGTAKGVADAKSSKVAPDRRLILVICVNYCNNDLTSAFVKHVVSLPSTADVRIAVVDNSAENEESALKALQSLARAAVYHPNTNLGYLGGADWGRVRFLEETGRAPEWTIVCNPDIELADDRFFDQLLALGEVDPEPPPEILAPNIILAETPRSGEPIHQNPYMSRRPPSFAVRASSTLARFPVLYALYDYLSTWRILTGVEQRRRVSPGACIYAPFGAFFVFHRSFFDHGGDLSNGPFLFGEEIFVAETARDLGLRIRYEPGLTVIHRQQLRRRSFATRCQQAKLTRDSLRFLVDRYFG